MKATTILALAFVSATTLANESIFSAFKEKDIKHFLKDRKVDLKKATDFDQLSQLAEEEFNKLKHEQQSRTFQIDVENGKQQILNLATDPTADLSEIFPENWDYLIPKQQKIESNNYYGEVKNWIFESWPAENLKAFLKTNKVKFDKKAPKQELIDTAKASWDDVTEKFEVSGKYAGDWLYESWSLDNIKNWLKEHEIEFDAKLKKDDLIDLVKQNNYIASLSSIDNKKSLLDSMKLTDLLIFDKNGKILQSFYDTWSYSQLREWLYYHGIIDTKPLLDLEEWDIKKLRAMAKSHEDYLASDIRFWVESSKDKIDPTLLKKPKTWKEEIDKIVNDSFLVGIDNWSKDRLKQFLTVRDVKFSKFSTKAQLVELVKSSKNIPVKAKQNIGFTPSSFFEGWSTSAIRDWLQDKGESIDGSRQELTDKINEYYQSLQVDPVKSAKAQVSNYKPDVDEFREYLQSSLEQTKDKVGDKSNTIADETLMAAYTAAIEYYNKASSVLEDKYKDNKFDFEKGLQQAQQSALEYSSKIADQGKKIKVDETVEAATAYANDLSVQLVDAFKNAKPAAYGLVDKISGLIHHHQPKKKVEDALNVAYQYAGEKYEDVKPHVDQAVDQSKEYADLAIKNINENGPEYYHKATDAAKQSYDEYEPVVAQAVQDANEAAQSAYSDYKPVVEEGYEKLKQYGNDAGAAAQSAYAEYIPKVKQAASDGYEYVIQSYSNADLKAYLQSFGFSRSLLNKLNRSQLISLANTQSGLFYGNTKNKWDKSIVEAIGDSTTNLQVKLGLKKKPSFWDYFKVF